MTDTETRGLGERWRAHPGFRWMPGMVDCEGMRVLSVRVGNPFVWNLDKGAGPMFAEQLAAPDLTDDATKGCLLAQLRELYDDEAHTLSGRYSEDRISSGWRWEYLGGSCLPGAFSTEVEAMVVALESADLVQDLID